MTRVCHVGTREGEGLVLRGRVSYLSLIVFFLRVSVYHTGENMITALKTDWLNADYRTQACRRRMHSLLSRAAHLCARCWLFLAHVTPTRPPLLRQYVVPRSAHEPRFSQAIAKTTRLLKSSSPHLLLFQSLFFCIILSRNKRLGPRRSWMKRLRARVALSYYFARATVERVSR